MGVLIVDDQAPFRRAAKMVMAATPGFDVIGEAEITNPEAMRAYGPMIVAAVKHVARSLSREMGAGRVSARGG